MIFKDLNNVDASVDAFASMQIDNSSPWSIQVDHSAVTGGSPLFTVMVSNKSGLVADMVAYSAAMTSKALATILSDAILAFKYIGVQYTAAGASGNVTVYFQQNPIKTVLY